MAQKFRLAFGTPSYVCKSMFRVLAYGKNIVFSCENHEFSRLKLPGLHLHDRQYDKERLAVLFDLGSLMSVSCVFNSEFMQTELFLERIQLRRQWLSDRNPHETVRTFYIFADVFERDVSQLHTPLIRNTVDEHTRIL
jgi:hypothetical protein